MEFSIRTLVSLLCSLFFLCFLHTHTEEMFRKAHVLLLWLKFASTSCYSFTWSLSCTNKLIIPTLGTSFELIFHSKVRRLLKSLLPSCSSSSINGLDFSVVQILQIRGDRSRMYEQLKSDFTWKLFDVIQVVSILPKLPFLKATTNDEKNNVSEIFCASTDRKLPMLHLCW